MINSYINQDIQYNRPTLFFFSEKKFDYMIVNIKGKKYRNLNSDSRYFI